MVARFFWCMLLLFCANSLSADVWVGRPGPDFTVRDVFGGEVHLDSYRGKIVVLEWQDLNSGYTNKFYSRLYYEGKGYLQAMQKRFISPPNDVVWLTIDVSVPTMSAEKWKEWLAQEGAVPTAVILDEKRTLTSLYGVTKVPMIFILDQEGMVVYKGSIDSLRTKDPSDITKPNNRHYLEMALEQLLSGKAVFTPDTIPYGTDVP